MGRKARKSGGWEARTAESRATATRANKLAEVQKVVDKNRKRYGQDWRKENDHLARLGITGRGKPKPKPVRCPRAGKHIRRQIEALEGESWMPGTNKEVVGWRVKWQDAGGTPLHKLQPGDGQVEAPRHQVPTRARSYPRYGRAMDAESHAQMNSKVAKRLENRS